MGAAAGERAALLLAFRIARALVLLGIVVAGLEPGGLGRGLRAAGEPMVRFAMLGRKDDGYAWVCSRRGARALFVGEMVNCR
jgi:hypothetical protein